MLILGGQFVLVRTIGEALSQRAAAREEAPASRSIAGRTA